MKYTRLILVLFTGFIFCFPCSISAQTDQVLNHTDDMVRVIYPGGATLDAPNANTGAIKITLPRPFKNSYVRLKVELYSNSATFKGQSSTIWLSGYTNFVGSSGNNLHKWVNPTAELVSSSTEMDIPVFFGDDGNSNQGQRKPVIWIGDQTQFWYHLKAHVVEVMVVDPQEGISFWDDSWAMTVDTGDQDLSIREPEKVSYTLPISKPNQTFEKVGEVTRFTNPTGGMNNLTGNGSIKITLPRGNSGSELRIRVELFNYVAGGQSESATVWLTGRNNSTWEGASAQIITSSENLAIPVYFGYDGDPTASNSRAIVWLGNQDEVWGDLFVQVAEVLSGKDNDPLSEFNSPWPTDWNITLDDGTRDGTSFRDITATLPLGASTLWQTDGANVLFADERQVAIGLADPGDFRLAVDGDVKARRVKVTAEDWPDYVFAEGYDLRSLESLREYLATNGHLPNVPSKEEAEQNGVYVNDMNVILLRKVEELTLYLLEQEERIKELEGKLDSQSDTRE